MRIASMIVVLCALAVLGQVSPVPEPWVPRAGDPAVWTPDVIVRLLNQRGPEVFAWLDANMTTAQKAAFVTALLPKPQLPAIAAHLDKMRNEFLLLGADSAPVVQAIDTWRAAVQTEIDRAVPVEGEAIPK